jgi:hypothetical protein
MTARVLMKSSALVLALAIASLGEAEVPSQAQSYFAGPSSLTVPLEQRADGKLYLLAKVEGHPMTLLVDTGATTIMDSTILVGLGVTLSESHEIATGLTGVAGKRQLATLDIGLGAMSITDLPVNALDLTAARTALEASGAQGFAGVLGTDLLAVLRARIDYDRRTLSLKRPTARSISQR